MTSGTRGADLTTGEYFTLRASAVTAATAGTNGTAYTLSGERLVIMLYMSVTALATDVGDTLDVYVDISPDGGTTWINAVHFPQQLGTGAAVKYVATLEATAGMTAPLVVTADAAVNVVRQGILGSQIRARYVMVDADADGNFTWSLTGYAV
jgi:hypothetical protein